MEKLKLVFIGDIHGRDKWKGFINSNPDTEQWIFVGDYVDSYDISNVDILNNLKDIIQFKKDNMEDVTLLLGNHDISYIYPGNRCSGFRAEAYPDIYDTFMANIDLFQMAFEHGKYIATHAGITNVWLKKNKRFINAEFKRICAKFKISHLKASLVEKLNWLQHSNRGRELLFAPCKYRSDYKYFTGGIVWVDKQESSRDMLDGYKQIVGHTRGVDFETFEKDDKTNITFIDVNYKPYIIEI